VRSESRATNDGRRRGGKCRKKLGRRLTLARASCSPNPIPFKVNTETKMGYGGAKEAKKYAVNCSMAERGVTCISALATLNVAFRSEVGTYESKA